MTPRCRSDPLPYPTSFAPAPMGENRGLDALAPRRSVRRVAGAILLVVVIGAGLAVHALLPDTPETDIAGDALYTAAVYLAVVIVGPRLSPLTVGGITAAWCVAVELFQLTGIPMALGAVFPPAMLALGTVFDGRDLLVYLVTAVVLVAADAVVSRAGHQGPRDAAWCCAATSARLCTVLCTPHGTQREATARDGTTMLGRVNVRLLPGT